MSDFDVIVIGGGIGGLISAGLLTSHGLKTLVVEKNEKTGGYLSSFKRKDFIFDAAVDCISGMSHDGLLRSVISFLDVDHKIDCIKVDPIRVSVFPGLEVIVDAELENYRERLIQLFPSEALGIKGFLDTAQSIYKALVSPLRFSKNNELKTITPEILKYSTYTYSDLLNDFITDERLKTVLSDRCPFIGLPPSQVSCLSMIALIMSYFTYGAYRIKGGFQKLADVLVEGIKRKGGTVITGREVTKINLNNDICQGITCDSGEHYSCQYIISNIDFSSTWNTLIGDKYSLSANKRLEKIGVSTSFFLVYAGIKENITRHSSLGYFTSYDMESFFKPESLFSKDFTLGITIASREDETRAPEECETVVLHEMFHDLEHKVDQNKRLNTLMTRAEEIITCFQERAIVVETAGPSTLENYTGNYKGSAFGWKQVPGFTNMKNIGIKNLSLAGHWATMGGGVLAAAYSGARAAQEILLKEGIKNCV